MVAGARRTHEKETGMEEYYPPQYRTADTLIGHLKFALKHEPLQLGIVVETLRQIGAHDLEAWVRREPTGKYSRRAWFFYETLLEETLDLPDAQVVGYVDALDEKRHYGAAGRNSPRYRVRDNLLGSAAFCPTLRRTRHLEAMQAAHWDAQEGEDEQGEDEQAVALRLLAGTLTEEAENEAPTGRSMADLFAGRVGLVSGSGEAYSENGGRRFAEHLARKQGQP